MSRVKFSLPLWFTLLGLNCAGQQQPQQAFTCTANAGAPVIVRVEGITELVGDLLLQCTGGAPTPPNQPVPLSNLTLSLSSQVTSRLLNPLNGFTEAALLIDEPGSLKNAVPQLVCGTPGAPSSDAPLPALTSPVSPPPALSTPSVKTCPLRGNGGSAGLYNGGFGYPNVYMARQVGVSALEWDGVPIDPPGSTGVRSIRMTNVRANAVQLGLSSTLIPTQIVAFVSVTGGQFFTINNPQQTLAFIQQGLVSGTNGGIARRDCDDTNTGFLQKALPSPIVSSNVNVREGFAQSFKRQFGSSLGPSFGSDPTASHAGTESGFSNPSLPNDPTLGNLGTLGSAAFGTRILLRFNNIGTGVRVVLPGVVPLLNPDGKQSGSMQLDSGGTPVPGVTGYQFLNTDTGSSGAVVYEVVNSDPTVIEQANIPVAMAYVGASVRGQIGQGTITVIPSFTGSYLPFAGASDPGGNVGALLDFQAKNPGVASNGLVLPNANPAFTLSSVRACPDQGGLLNSVVPNNFSGTAQFNTFLRPNGKAPIVNLPQWFNYGLSAPDIQVDNLNVVPNAEVQAHDAKAVVTSNWLSVQLNESNTPATATISVNSTGLAAGAYSGTVTINSLQSINSLAVPVRLNVAPVGPLLVGPGITSAGSYVSNVVAPGEAVVIFGDAFGPATLAGAALGADGKLTNNVGGTRVLFDGVAAPMYYAVAGQVAAFAPFALAGKTSTQVQVEYNGVKSPAVQIPVLDAVPSLFTANGSGGGAGAILNQDQSFNSVAPESPGNLIVLFGTGAGQTNPGGRDGAPAGVGGTLGTFLLPIKVFIDGQPATDITYAGPAPSLVEGVFQIDVRIPANARHNANLPVVVQVGDKQTQSGVTVAVR